MMFRPTSPASARRAIAWMSGPIAAAILLASPAHAQIIQLPDPKPALGEPVDRLLDADQVRPTFDRLVADLASANFAARQAASTTLATNEQFTLEMLESALKSPDLTLEARYRLFGIARQRFFRSPRAALGFKFGGQLRDRVVVGETFPNFASFKVLQIGDMIVGADGMKIEGPGGQAMLQSIIISHDPGEIIHLTIRRGPQKLDLDIPLGKFADLDNAGAGLFEDRLARAWRIRSQSRMGANVEPVRVDGPTPPWMPAADDAQRKLDAAMRREANVVPLQIVGGGMPRAAQATDDARFAEQGFRPQVVVMPNGQARIINMPVFRNAFGGIGGGFGDFDPDNGRQAMKPEEELAQLLQAKMELTKRLGGLDLHTLPPTDPRRPALLETQKQLDLIKKQFDAIDAEHKEAQAASPKDKHSAVEATTPPLP
ncbi:MAG TPA: hypothetical protein PKE29_16825 [Phycisphaerales bacterium]|nr:hypothetical protein [Phycisphaerales bacterium]